ncbi:MAG: MFS transporter [Armatimonadetes bacterium]|nr:MFS transporter [Anaerolineae bacterium]
MVYYRVGIGAGESFAVLQSTAHHKTENANYIHLVADILWFGLALAATVRFASVYAIRLDATSFELGLLSALPGLFMLIGTLLTGWWRRHFTASPNAMFLPSMGFRLVFLLPALTPLMPQGWQVAWLIFALTITAIPQGIAGTLFVVLMREGISDERLPQLWSRRLVALNFGLIISSLVFGYMLKVSPLHEGYALMFLVAFVLVMVSQVHVMRVKVLRPMPVPSAKPFPELMRVWRSPNLLVVGVVVLAVHLTVFSVAPMINKHLISGLGATEEFIAWFGVAELVAAVLCATFADKLMLRLGARTLIAVSMLGTALAALLVALAPSLPFTLLSAFVQGISWTACSVAMFGFFLQRTSNHQMQDATMMFNVVVGLGIFIGSLIGGVLADAGMSLVTVLLVGAGLRFAAAWLITETRRAPAYVEQLAPTTSGGD